jgi:hypothetical protein
MADETERQAPEAALSAAGASPARLSLIDAVAEAEQACVAYAAVGDALGYPGVRGRELLTDAVRDLARWVRGGAADH